MRGRRVLISCCRWNGEGALSDLLRMAVSLASGYRGHRVEVALLGEGILTAVAPSADGWDRYYRSARAYPIPIYVDQASLESRGLKPEDLAVQVEPRTREELIELGRSAEHQVKL